MLIASHDPIVYEAGIVDRVIHLRDGKVEKTTGPAPDWFADGSIGRGPYFPGPKGEAHA